MLSAQGFKVDLSAIHFFSIGGQISCFFKGFSCDGEDGGGGAVRVEGRLSFISPVVF